MEDTLGDKLKEMEAAFTVYHDQNLTLVVRLDGRSFSKITRNLAKPFSVRFIELMQDTTESLMHHFSADVGFCQSDEITLVFLPRPTVDGFVYPFKGKQAKIQSLLAAHATWYFNNAINDNSSIKIHIPEVPICFDARSLSMTYEDAALMLMWRHKDATRNAILQYAHNCGHFNKKSLNGVKTHEVLSMIGEIPGMDWEEIPRAFRMGTFILAQYEKKGLPITKDYFTGNQENTKTIYKKYFLDRSYHIVYEFMINKFNRDVVSAENRKSVLTLETKDLM